MRDASSCILFDAMSTPGPARIALVEDHDATRAALVESLADHADRVRLVATFADAESLLRSRGLSEIDLVLMDLGLPGMSGSEATRRLAEVAPRIRVLVLTAFDDARSLFGALASGAHGYLVKDESTARIVAALEEASAGEHPISSRVAGFLITRARRAPPPVSLSEREEELARALADGLTYADAASRA